MKLYLVRHGQSVANATKIHSGWSQVPLTEQGRADAARAGEYLQTLQFDRVYSSDLTRAIETAQIALPDCTPTQLSLIRERTVGSLVGRPFEECAAEYGDAYWAARASLDFTPFGGENPEMLTARAREFLNFLAENPADNIVAFTHEGFIGSCLEVVFGFPIDRRRLRCANGSITILSFENGFWRLNTYGR